MIRLNHSVFSSYHHEHSPAPCQIWKFQSLGHASFSPPSPRRILILLGLQPEILVLVVSEAGIWTVLTDCDQR